MKIPNGAAQDKKLLIYTIAYDQPGKCDHATMARILVASLLRSGYEGEIVVFHNQRHALFEHGRRNVVEIRIDKRDLPKQARCRTPHRLKYAVRRLYKFEKYAKVMFVDADCIAFKNPTWIFEATQDILFHTEPGMPITWSQFNGYLRIEEMQNLRRDGINSGVFVLDGKIFHDVMCMWEEIDKQEPYRGDRQHEQCAWNRLILDNNWTKLQIKEGTILCPYFGVQYVERQWTNKQGGSNCQALLRNYSTAALVDATIIHVLGPHPPSLRTALMFGLYMTRYYADKRMLLFNLLEP
jgi:hypothetical protein